MPSVNSALIKNTTIGQVVSSFPGGLPVSITKTTTTTTTTTTKMMKITEHKKKILIFLRKQINKRINTGRGRCQL
jgi:hypothetical protein